MRIGAINLADPDQCAAAWRVQRAAYEVEAALIGSRGMAGLRETVAELAANRAEVFAGCWLAVDATGFPAGGGERLVGVVAVEARSGGGGACGLGPGALGAAWVISRLAVDPACGRRGVGRALVRWVLAEHARSAEGVGAARAAAAECGVWVSTGAANAPARRLYEAEGFVRSAERCAPDGTALVEYRWGGV